MLPGAPDSAIRVDRCRHPGAGAIPLRIVRAGLLRRCRARDLPPEVMQKGRARRGDDTLDLHEQERLSIERALERFGGNRRRAADALKISTVTLWRRMKQYGILS